MGFIFPEISRHIPSPEQATTDPVLNANRRLSAKIIKLFFDDDIPSQFRPTIPGSIDIGLTTHHTWQVEIVDHFLDSDTARYYFTFGEGIEKITLKTPMADFSKNISYCQTMFGPDTIGQRSGLVEITFKLWEPIPHQEDPEALAKLMAARVARKYVESVHAISPEDCVTVFQAIQD